MLMYHCSRRILFSGGSDIEDEEENFVVESSHAQAATNNTSTHSGIPLCQRDNVAFR